jgi:hypothetical protein
MNDIRAIRPLIDETLMSYLNRSLQTHDSRYYAIHKTINQMDMIWSETSDRDYYPASSILELASNALECSPASIELLTLPNTWLLISGRRDRKYYCAACIFSDVSSGRHPSWRKQWDGFENISCSMHGLTMATISDAYLRYDKARVAYSNACIEYEVVRRDEFVRKCGSSPTLRNTAGAWTCLWQFSRHVQVWINMSRARSCIVSGIFQGFKWHNCDAMFRCILALSLRGHTHYHEQRCLVSRIFNNYTIYNPSMRTLDGGEKLAQGLMASNLSARMLGLIVLGIYCQVFSRDQLYLLEKICTKLRFSLPSSLRDLKSALLLSDVTDYDSLLASANKSWPTRGVLYWDSL